MEIRKRWEVRLTHQVPLLPGGRGRAKIRFPMVGKEILGTQYLITHTYDMAKLARVVLPGYPQHIKKEEA
ncbi:MAG: hypothetical protein DSZ28_02640 [Thiothrix sp.]|nr:MAG: hypothetical protein DSZ28_02640 [Thiothrix sp.]